MKGKSVVPKLIVVKGLISETYVITSDSISIGRSPSNDFQVTAEGVSRVHAKLTRVDDEFFLCDLQSTNGTYLNGQRIYSETKLQHNDTIELGRTVTLRFEKVL